MIEPIVHIASPPVPSLFALTRDELADALASHDLPRYRADQLLRWAYAKRQRDPDRNRDQDPVPSLEVLNVHREEI